MEKKKGEKSPKITKKDQTVEIEGSMPLMTSMGSYSEASGTAVRRNLSSTIERTDKFKNISDGLLPFKHTSTASSNNVDVRDAVILCQKCYYNFAIFRNTIDLMTEFSATNLYFQGGSKKSQEFFTAYFKTINLWEIQDCFFREYYRSGNVFIYRFDAEIKNSDLIKMTQTFGNTPNSKSTTVTLPAKYIILNPADVQVGGNISFASNIYYKLLTDYERERLKNPQTDEDKQVFESLEPKIKELLKSRSSSQVVIPLDPTKIQAVFYKKQHYEPFAVPMGYPVLSDINAKEEMKKMDMAIARTMQQVVLLINMGESPKDGGMGPNPKAMEAMRALFENESIGRVLVADWTTKMSFIIPQIGDILDPKKYEVIDKDIALGLNYILIGSEKFANQSIKVQVFLERLKQAREAFINKFLMPEIKRISKELGFKNYPTPYFEDVDLKDNLEFSKVYTRLMELGILTPEEGITAINSGRLPTQEESEESQSKYKTLKEKGYYEPIVGGPSTQKELADKQIKSASELADKNQQNQVKLTEMKTKVSAPGGRPAGTKRKQSTKKVGPIGGSELYSMSKLKDVLISVGNLHLKVVNHLRDKHKVDSLSTEQFGIADQILEIIVANEPLERWNEENVAKYCALPVDTDIKRVAEINEIALSHNLNTYAASLLYLSKKE